MAVTVESPFPYVVAGNRIEINSVLDELLVLIRSISQEVPARAADNADNPFSKESQDMIKAAGNTELCELLDAEPKAQCKVCLSYWNELSMLLKITLKCMSMRVVLDLVNKIFERCRHVIVALQNVVLLEC